ncbi:DUF6603 domain-containing protein [Dyella nitratireducens]|uniref:DUF6603 domain-containing protein n=1 Tax=Dyella nitratireducens TaxID=1849580 RepID=A0ABQ1GDX2_9GAMM|nr:DUF6603 domain-containing protein [Dyella nitratireducens]GGA41840.1 hypothetical protein GCM10010981_33560 [Dyella nitratireducens]GLQ42088.1 hypothetical protein GCM10007902_19380 [Dyella nitratireducens]
MSAAGTLESLVKVIADTLTPLGRWLAADQVDNFFADLGLRFTPSVTTQPAIASALQAVSTSATNLSTSATALGTAISGGNAATIITSGADTIAKLGTLLDNLEKVGQALSANASAFPGIAASDVSAFASALPAALFDAASISLLELYAPGVLNTLAMTGLVDRHLEPGVTGNTAKPPYEVRRLRPDRIATFLQSPNTYFQTLYGWGSSTFDGQFLFGQLQELAGYIGLPATLVPAGGGQPITLDLFGAELQVDSGVSPPGLKAELLLSLAQNVNAVNTLSPSNWTLTITGSGNFAADLVAHVAPPAKVSVTPPSGTVSGQLQAQFALQPSTPGTPIVLIGQTGGSVLQANSLAFGAGIAVTWNGSSASAAPLVSASISGGKLVIDMSDADGFLSSVTSGTPIQATFDLALTWLPDAGLHVTGGAQLEIDLPLHLTLGPVTLPTVYVVGGIDNGNLTLELSAALGVTLGPLQASVDRVGVLGTFDFPSSGHGNLGPLDLQVAFKPPNGLGLELDMGLAAGGGYITFDPKKGQYAGVLQVSLVDIVQVTVIGVLDTIMPDGSSGFSLILVITFDLPPIQLGFGFTLDGVGGVGGINRTMAIDALQAGFRAHTLDMVLAPPDPIANAPQIISDISNFFPVAEGRYLFGPMLTIGWGTPTLVSLDVGVLLEVPDPVRIVILGLIDAGLPTEDEALLQLHIAVLGVIDFGAETLSIDGSLYDSSLLIYSMSGDLAFRLAWGSNPNMVFSLGGFNPHFNTDGLNVPANMHRMSVSIGVGNNPCISCNSYFAITSNSIQFGANVQAYAEAAGFSVQGYLGFDLLVIISPFSFEFDFSASFDVAFEGVTLLGLSVNGLISGPTPWHFHGDASITLLFFTVSASIDLTWGSSTQATIPQQPVLPDLFKALQAPSSWSAALPSGTGPTVTLTKPASGSQTLLVHPMGTLTVKETVVPLDLAITRYGNAAPSDGTEFSIGSVSLNAQNETIQTITDYFAPGQFLTLSDADKLSKPSFESFDAGVTIGSSTVLSGHNSARTVTYDEYYVDAAESLSRFNGVYQMPAHIHLALCNQGAGFNSPAKHTGLGKYSAAANEPSIGVQDASYVVTSVMDLSMRTDIVSSTGSTFYQAQAALDSYLTAHPEESSNLQIQPLYEVAA